MLGLDSSTMLLALSLLALKATSQDIFGWLITDCACTGGVGVQSIHHRLCEFHLPTLSEVVRRSKVHAIVFLVGDPT